MSTNASWQQATHILRLFDEKGTPREQVQKLCTSGLLADLLDGNIDQVNREDFRQLLGLASLVNLPKKPLPFQKNQNGHYVLTLTGASRLGTEEISYLEGLGFVPSDYAKRVLGSTGPDSYDAKHRLAEGQIYQVALVPGRDYKAFGKRRTTKNLQAYGQSFGYGKALAGMIPRVRETVSDEQMEEMGFWYLAGLHDPIEADGHPLVLYSDRIGSRRFLFTSWVRPDRGWDGGGAFVFPVSP
jgi:hypothetical protein